jgi:hypothetical protein
MEKEQSPDPAELCVAIKASCMIICNNKFRLYISQLFDIKSMSLIKMGPLRKYFQEGIVRLSSRKNITDLPMTIEYKGNTIELHVIEREKANLIETENQKKMYFGGAGPHSTIDQIVSYFSTFGAVTYSKMMQQSAQNGTKFGFLIFHKRESLDRIYEAGRHVIGGYQLIVCDYLNKNQNRSRRFTTKSSYSVERSKLNRAIAQPKGDPRPRSLNLRPFTDKHEVPDVACKKKLPTEITILDNYSNHSYNNLRFNRLSGLL